MIPTQELRWEKRTTDRHPKTKQPLYRASWVIVLQQRWVGTLDEKVQEEWRDVPIVEEAV